jgi:membrane-bound lytic murein transglycosylase B
MRRLLLSLGLLSVLVQQGIGGASQDPPPQGLQAPQPFDKWLADLQSEALARGYDASVVQHLAALQPLERVIAADRSQAELNPGFDRYLSSRVTPLMVKRGKEHARANATTLRRVENATVASRGTRPSCARWPRWRGSRGAPSSSGGSSSTRSPWCRSVTSPRGR